MKIWKYTAAALAASLFLTACYGGPLPANGSVAAAQTTSADTAATDGSSSSKNTAKTDKKLHRKVTRALSSRRVRAGGSGKIDKLYDLTDFLSEGKGTLCSYALMDGSHILLLSLAAQDTGSTETSSAGGENRSTSSADIEDSTYYASVLDLTSGKLSEYQSWPLVINEDLASVAADEASAAADTTAENGALTTAQETVSGASADMPGTDYINIISADPLVVYDTMNAVLYVPDSAYKAICLPRYLSDAEPSLVNGRLWLTSNRGMVFSVQEDGSLQTAWVLPDNFRWLSTEENGVDDHLTLTTYAQNGEDPIRIDLNPGTGSATYYQVRTEDASYYAASGYGILASTYVGGEEVLTLFDTKEETKKTLRMPASMESSLSSKSGSISSFLTIGLSKCSILQDWCCFAFEDSGGHPVRLYLWDTSAARGEDWTEPTVMTYTLPEEMSYVELSSKAGELSRKYDVHIVLGENVPSFFADYNVSAEMDAETIQGALSVLENVLSLYPDGYFTQLKGFYYRDLIFYLTGTMTPRDATLNISNAGAFTTEENGLAIVALNLEDEDLSPATVIHELNHVLDYRLEASGELDETAWNSMNPKGFDYYYSYIDSDGNSYESTGNTQYTVTGGYSLSNIWFYDPYSKTYPMEDRARLMDRLLDNPEQADDFFAGPHIRQKLTWYFRVIRSALDDGSWPAQTIWEKTLQSAAASS